MSTQEEVMSINDNIYKYVKLILIDFNNSQYLRCLNTFEEICNQFPKEEIVIFMHKYREFNIPHIIMKSLTNRLIMKPDIKFKSNLINYLDFFEIMCKENVEKVRFWLNQYKLNFSDIIRTYPSFFKNIEYIIEKNDYC
jgi:hypothetical protein